MQNNFTQHIPHPHDSPMNTPLQQQEIMYTQKFQCQCSQVFNTIDEYQLHILNDHHDHYLSSHTINQANSQVNKEMSILGPGQPNLSQIPATCHLNPNQHQKELPQMNLLISSRQENQNSALRNFNIQNDYQVNQHSQNQQFSHFSHLSQANYVKASSIVPPQQKEINFRYVQAYYEHKMNPFYRQFDIQPFRSQTTHKQKSHYIRQLKKLHQSSPVEPYNSMNYVRQNAFRDQQKLNTEFDARMIPIENGIIEFIQNFIKENTKQIGEVTTEKREFIQTAFIQKITNLQQLNLRVYQKGMAEIPNPYEEEDFMQTDLFKSLNKFTRFLSEKLRFYEMWIVETIVIIIMDTIIQYYSKNHEEMYENLKVSDMAYLYSSIQMNAESKQYGLPFQISSLTITQFLTCFNQWCSILQYINNKSRVDFIEPMLDQINQINEVYRDNVFMYRKSTKKRRIDYVKRMKRKIIEKKIEIKRQNMAKKDLKEMFWKWGINSNLQRRSTDDGYELLPNRNPHTMTNTNAYLPFSNATPRKQPQPMDANKYDGISKRIVNNGQQQKRQSTQQSAKILSQEEKIRTLQQQMHQKSNDQENESGDSYESSHEFIPKQSHYEDYFGAQKLQQRQKIEEKWNIKFDMLKKILCNSSSFKPIMRQQIHKQLKEVNVLSDLIEIESRQYFSLKRVIHNFLKQYTNASTQPIDQDNAENVDHTQNIQSLYHKLETNPKDPFLIIKDFRFNRYNDRRADLSRNYDLQIGSERFISDEPHQDRYAQQKDDDPFDALL